MTCAYIGLGSNLNDPEQQLKDAIDALNKIQDTVILEVSSFYRSKPVGPENQPEFMNAVASLDTQLSAINLLQELHRIEKLQGRIRSTSRWGPRTLDLDLLLFGNEKIDSDVLTIPHSEMHKRGFVLCPLHEISPNIEIPGHGPVAILLEQVNTDDVQKILPR